MGETGLFWVDLGSSQGGNLVDGNFTTATCATTITAASGTSTTDPINIYMPAAKLGKGHYIYVYDSNEQNWYGLSVVTAVSTAGSITSASTMTVIQAYNIDKKMDDSYPISGNVVAQYLSGTTIANPTHSGALATTNCYDTANNTATGEYEITENNGSAGLCALSFQFQ